MFGGCGVFRKGLVVMGGKLFKGVIVGIGWLEREVICIVGNFFWVVSLEVIGGVVCDLKVIGCICCECIFGCGVGNDGKKGKFIFMNGVVGSVSGDKFDCWNFWEGRDVKNWCFVDFFCFFDGFFGVDCFFLEVIFI